jgi:hypothetical protein
MMREMNGSRVVPQGAESMRMTVRDNRPGKSMPTFRRERAFSFNATLGEDWGEGTPWAVRCALAVWTPYAMSGNPRMEPNNR